MIDLNEAKRQLAGRYDQFAKDFAPQLEYVIDAPKGKKVTCPVHDAPNKFNVHPQFAQNGKWYSYIDHNNSNGQQGIWDFLIWATGCSLSELRVAANQFLNTAGIQTPSDVKKNEKKWKAIQAAEYKKAAEAIAKVREESINDIRCVGHYLKKRGISKIQPPQNVVFNPSCFFRDQELNIAGNARAAILEIENPVGEVIALHRIYLNDKCEKHEAGKKMMPVSGEVMGAACRCFPMGENGVIGVAEGFETACAVNELFNIPCWSTISAPMLAGFIPPIGVKKVMIFADKDKSLAGQKAAEVLKGRMDELGVPSLIMLPNQEIPEDAKSIDWLDVLNTFK